MRDAGPRPDVVTWNAAILACRNAGKHKQAIELFRDLESHDELQPNAASYDLAITAAKRANKPSLVRALMQAEQEHSAK